MEDKSWFINGPTDSTVLEIPCDILASFHYFKNVNIERLASWGTRIIGDSGAFSAMSSGTPIDREEFHSWVARYKEHLFWAASLDVIGDEKASFQNWLASKKDGLDLVPTLHYGANPEAMDALVENGASLIGLGGMVPFSSEKDRLMRWTLSMHRYARDNFRGVRFHGWGISHPYLLDNLPWWSADSSGFASCFRFGTLRLWVPPKERFISVNLNGRDLRQYDQVLKRYYGQNWRHVASSTSKNRREVGRVALRGVQLYGQWLRSRQQVSPPALLQARIEGPLTAAAWAPGGNVGSILDPSNKGPRMVAADTNWNRTFGPLPVGAMSPGGGQGQAVTPNGFSIAQEAKT